MPVGFADILRQSQRPEKGKVCKADVELYVEIFEVEPKTTVHHEKSRVVKYELKKVQKVIGLVSWNLSKKHAPDCKYTKLNNTGRGFVRKWADGSNGYVRRKT